jgi:hypothetical protein
VNGSPVTGEGTTVLQCVFPLDRRQVYEAPATQPVATQPSTRMAGADKVESNVH